MIRQNFKEWVENNIKSFQSEGISTEFVMPDVDIELLAKPFIRIIQETKCCMGQVIVYESREMEYEVLHMDNTEELLLWRYFENIDDGIEFDLALNQYFYTLKTGTKPAN